MDFLNLIVSVAETGALLMALVFVTRAMKEKKAAKGKATPNRKRNYILSCGFLLLFVLLNVVSNTGILG